MTFALRALFGLAFAYAVVVAALWFFQSRFIYPAPQSPAVLVPGYQEVTLQTLDGLALRSFFKPAEAGMPTVVYFHGNAGNLGGAVVSNNALVAHGMGALLVEYRGYGGNDGAPSEEAFYSDAEAAVAWLTERNIRPDELIFIGNSIGSGVATEMASRYPPRALILIAPFTSLPGAAAENLWWLPVEQLMRDRFDNLAKIPHVDVPILIQHGSADQLIPPSHGRTLSQATQRAQFQSFDERGHDLSFEYDSQVARRDWIIGLTQDRAP
ncbi:alpha/beta hydrolase [Erythrobacter rubeus]|uniref:Alpha/beta hydrolase n=1 Tax=Erythrobacter rubeus TaxID=2760803 RepID=A0ABR8KQQ7_9SPHN|nr:alpha/beta hydrolase [Erythrobacter rubeus]MBD2843098.1 alpha/beta hydrolase [Erythrobacter rubeus]